MGIFRGIDRILCFAWNLVNRVFLVRQCVEHAPAMGNPCHSVVGVTSLLVKIVAIFLVANRKTQPPKQPRSIKVEYIQRITRLSRFCANVRKLALS